MPHALSDMSSSPAQKPGSPAARELLNKGMRKFRIVNHIIQNEDALIKPGEDALDLRARTQYRRNPAAATRPPGRQCSRRTGTSISSEYSATSYASNGSNSTASGGSNSSSSSLASLARRTDGLGLDYSTRQQSQCRSDANTSYIFHASEKNVSETTPVPEAAATASTVITSPHPGIDHVAPGTQPL